MEMMSVKLAVESDGRPAMSVRAFCTAGCITSGRLSVSRTNVFILSISSECSVITVRMLLTVDSPGSSADHATEVTG